MNILLNIDDTTKSTVAGIIFLGVVLLIGIIRRGQVRKAQHLQAQCPYGDHDWRDYYRLGWLAGKRCRKCGVLCLDGQHAATDVLDNDGHWRAYCTICGKQVAPRARH